MNAAISPAKSLKPLASGAHATNLLGVVLAAGSQTLRSELYDYDDQDQANDGRRGDQERKLAAAHRAQPERRPPRIRGTVYGGAASSSTRCGTPRATYPPSGVRV